MNRSVTLIVENEGDGYAALCPELDVATQGQELDRSGQPARPDDLAEEIIENLEAGLNSFREVLAGLWQSDS